MLSGAVAVCAARGALDIAFARPKSIGHERARLRAHFIFDGKNRTRDEFLFENQMKRIQFLCDIVSSHASRNIRLLLTLQTHPQAIAASGCVQSKQS